MKSDIDRLMTQRGIDVLFITGPAQHNPMMTYFTGPIHVTHADLLKVNGQSPVLLHNPMEREEAAKTGFTTLSYSEYPLSLFMAEADNDSVKATALRYKKILMDLGIQKGKIGLFGQIDLGEGYAVFTELQRIFPELHLVGMKDDSLLLEAMMTKDPEAISRIRSMGKVTTEVVGMVADFLAHCKSKDSKVVRDDGTPITIGKVKKLINLWLAERGAENPEGTIFAMGRDAGIPHSTGTDSDILEIGKPIVFDIYPCEAGGGYFYDFTRTWCLDFSPDEVSRLYEDVKSVYDKVTQELKMDEIFSKTQKKTCSLFESMGYPTLLSTPNTEEGYVHSIGHGLGLLIHEKPFSGFTSPETDKLHPGTVFTIEPGLYYPQKNVGIRLEDTYLAHPDGAFEKLAEYPMDLVLPIGR